MNTQSVSRFPHLRFIFISILSLTLVACGGGGGGGGGGVAAPGAVAVAPGPVVPPVIPPPPGASPCDISTGGCTVTWALVADARVTGYRIYIGTGASIPVTVVNAQFIDEVVGPTTLAYNFSAQSLAAVNAAFLPNTLVSIAVSAIGAGGIESPLSAVVPATI